MLERLKITQNNTQKISRRRALIITLVAVVIVYLLWNVPQLSSLAYPFRLFVTYVHEAGHSAMAWLTGGRVLGFTVSPDGSGVAVTAGGNRALIIPAGYLGAALFGSLLFYIVNTIPRPRLISAPLGAALIVFTLLFARPDASGLPLALTVGLLVGLLLLALAWKASRDINLLVLNVLAMMTALNAVLDVVGLIQHSHITVRTPGGGVIHNDAVAFSREIAPLIPPAVWALLWALIAIVMTGAAVYFSLIRPMLRNRTGPDQ
jgi:hypothetical protein